MTRETSSLNLAEGGCKPAEIESKEGEKMSSVKDNIKEELLKLIYQEEDSLMQRQVLCDSAQEAYQCTCERNFLNKLKTFGESL